MQRPQHKTKTEPGRLAGQRKWKANERAGRPKMEPGEWLKIQTGVLLDLGRGISLAAVAREYELPLATVKHIQLKQMKRAEALERRRLTLNEYSWRDELAAKSIENISEYLDTEVTSKSATVAQGNLKGLGYFAADQQTTIQQMFTSVPAEWKEEYLPGSAKEIEAKEKLIDEAKVGGPVQDAQGSAQ